MLLVNDIHTLDDVIIVDLFQAILYLLVTSLCKVTMVIAT
jgi:hypothetical protein